MMRTWILLLGCLATACGGNFSNEDLEFLNALPKREALSAKLPGSESFERKGSARQRVGSLALGELSQIYANTRQAVDDFNAGLDGALSFLEEIRKNAPTTRTPALRIWGPMESPHHPGHEVRLGMERKPEGFQYRVEFRPIGSDEEAWWSIAMGSVQPGGGLHKGTGTLSIFTAEMRKHGIHVPPLMNLERLDIDYQTSAPPISVRMHSVPTPESSPVVSYTYRELPEGLGEMRFLHAADFIPGGQKEKMAILSRWTRDQGGRAIVEATGGDVPEGSTDTLVECWDASFRTTYIEGSRTTDEVGDDSSCPDVSALED